MSSKGTITSTSLRVVSRFGKGYGYIPDLADFRDHYATFGYGHLPSSADLTHAMPPVYDQGELGSCTGNAIAAAVQFERMKQAIADADKLTPSRLFIYYGER